MEAIWSNFYVFPFRWKWKRTNVCNNVKTWSIYNLHAQEVFLLSIFTEEVRWLSINISHKTFFNWTIQILGSFLVHMTHIFLNN
jgi:hypothetical protein